MQLYHSLFSSPQKEKAEAKHTPTEEKEKEENTEAMQEC